MKTRIQRLGEGLALLIPPEAASQPAFADNAEVEVTFEHGMLVARPIGLRRYTVEELLEGVTEDQLHPETNTGPSVGNEAW